MQPTSALQQPLKATETGLRKTNDRNHRKAGIEPENEWESARTIGGAIRRLSSPAGGGAPHPGSDGPRIVFNGMKPGFMLAAGLVRVLAVVVVLSCFGFVLVLVLLFLGQVLKGKESNGGCSMQSLRSLADRGRTEERRHLARITKVSRFRRRSCIGQLHYSL